LQGENFPVGVIENDRYQEKTQHYDEKDLFVFYSDGVTEATDSSGEMFGTERIIDIIRLNAEVPAKALLHLIKQSLIRFVGEDKFDDDVTIIVVKATQEALIEDDCYHSARFNSDFSQLEAVRGVVDRRCQNTPGDREQLSQQLQLVINEAFANIVEHSYSGQSGHTIIVNLCLKEEGVFIELLDQGESFQPDAVSEPSLAGDQSDGFGVYIIREMTDSVSYQPRRSASGWNHLRLYKKYCIQGESMEFTHEKENEVLVVTLNGDNLDAREAPKFKETMSKLIGEEQVANVVFDLDRLKFIDSSGLGSILSVLRLANNQGGDVKLASMTKPIQAMFEVVRMHKLFEIYHTKEDAVNSFVKRCNG
jgi:anti-anti-sigma factor